MEAVLQSIANAAGTFCPSHMRYVNADHAARAFEELRLAVVAADKEKN